MVSGLMQVFGDLGNILAVCPCEECCQLFYLSDAHVHLVGKRPQSIVDTLRTAERKLDKEDEKLSLIEDALRDAAAKAGKKATKKRLKRIDTIFSGAGYDPQDVKVIFDPVMYVLFDGMSEGNVSSIVLLARQAENKVTEDLQSSIKQAIKKGNIEFKTLHVSNDGQVLTR
jgi:predicted Holliday junction resolvase-like endonuclease